MKTTDNHNEPKLNIEGISEQELKRNAFKTPEGYFENLTPRVMESVRNSERPVKAGWSVWMKFLPPSIGVAAVALAAWFFIPPTANDTPDFDTVLASLTVEELATYADLQPSELVSYELIDYHQVAMNESKLTDDDIIEYLETEEDVELNTIMNEIEI
ncbi:MAG: hypothetical protein GC178_04175 [Flavobacteriales bacterium]|nr:hypothetical protein [Flavobacteriales bacterium]